MAMAALQSTCSSRSVTDRGDEDRRRLRAARSSWRRWDDLQYNYARHVTGRVVTAHEGTRRLVALPHALAFAGVPPGQNDRH